jgi:enoyl-CoA hydratase/carnithine racemase
MGQINVEQRGRVLLAVLENPPHGLMDAGIVDGLDELVQRASGDDQIGAVVLTGAHPERFLAHYDVAELLAGGQAGPAVTPRVAHASLRVIGGLRRVAAAEQAISRTPAAGLAAIERFHSILLSMNRSGAVFVAAINGSAMGGGCELALACDVRLMASGDHLLGQPEILLGFPPGGGGTQRLARLLGSSRALSMVLGGAPLSPAQAFDIGLVSEVVAGEQLRGRAVAVAEYLGRRPKLAVAASKRAVYEGGSRPLPEGLRLEAAEFAATLGSPDAIAAMTAYVERTNSTGVLPAYDRPVLERALAEGRFRQFDDTDRR